MSGLEITIDGIMVLLLGATVFFAARLSTHLKAFRDSRSELEQLLGELGDNIKKAEHSIEGLRLSAREAGRDLQGLINDASALSDELQIMTEAGDNMATRLEKLAEKNSRLVTREEVSPLPRSSEDEFGGFAIQDPEFEDEEDEPSYERTSTQDLPSFLKDEPEPEESERLQTKAERDLYEAMRARGRRTSAGGV
jgi:chromosome segregation ATPase